MKKIPEIEYKWIECELGFINPLFKEMWIRLEYMVFDNDAESVELEIHNNNFRIVARKKFWDSCSRDKRIFIICHELCHVMFGHWLIDPSMDREWSNIAQDIQINEFLMKTYFPKFKDKDFATIKMVFKDKSSVVKQDQDYRYYYDLLMKCLKKPSSRNKSLIC